MNNIFSANENFRIYSFCGACLSLTAFAYVFLSFQVFVKHFFLYFEQACRDNRNTLLLTILEQKLLLHV